MEPVISYFDTTIGCVSFNITPAASQEMIDSVVQANEARKAQRGDVEGDRMRYALSVAHVIEERHYPLLVHEWSHVLQAIAYPALYVRCLREFNFTMEIVRGLRVRKEEIPVPIPVEPEWLSSLRAGVQPFRVNLVDGAPKVEAPDPDRLMPSDLTETDLVEDAASIFQYKVEIDEPGSADGYLHWLEERYGYSKTFDLVSEVLGPEEAFIALPCLVLGAHMTNWPVNGFIWMLATVARAPGLASMLGTDGLWQVLMQMMEESAKEIRTPEPAAHVGAESLHHWIDEAAMRDLIEQWPRHPLTPLAADAWRDKVAIAEIRAGLLHPYRAFSGRYRRAADWIDRYMPPMMTFRLLGPEMTIGDTVGFVAPRLQSDSVPGLPGTDWSAYLFELLRMKAFAFSVATPFGEQRRHNCPHHECRFHPTDICSRWTFVPTEHAKCEFPDWLRDATERQLDFDSLTLMPLIERGKG